MLAVDCYKVLVGGIYLVICSTSVVICVVCLCALFGTLGMTVSVALTMISQSLMAISDAVVIKNHRNEFWVVSLFAVSCVLLSVAFGRDPQYKYLPAGGLPPATTPSLPPGPTPPLPRFTVPPLPLFTAPPLPPATVEPLNPVAIRHLNSAAVRVRHIRRGAVHPPNSGTRSCFSF